MTAAAFDERVTLDFNVARGTYVRGAVGELGRDLQMKTAIDVGCGYGYFTEILVDLGFDVTAVDGREENVAETGRRNPSAHLATLNVEDPALDLGRFDLVLCLGLLYHLENPFAAIRNLARLAAGVVLLESVCVPSPSPMAVLYDEDHDIDQGLDYIALIPSETGLVKMLYHSGFSHVYRPSRWPDHPYFRSTAAKHRRRTILLAARQRLAISGVEEVAEPRTRRHMWDRFGQVLESERIRSLIKVGLGRG